MLAAAESGAAENVERSAHTLKSASANVGGLALAHMCEGLQRRGRAGELSDVLERSCEAQVEFERVRAELANRLLKLAG